MKADPMPARCKALQKMARAALAASHGEMPKGKLKGASCDMDEPVSETERDDMAHFKHSNLWNHKSED
jgi:hypothetical protein